MHHSAGPYFSSFLKLLSGWPRFSSLPLIFICWQTTECGEWSVSLNPPPSSFSIFPSAAGPTTACHLQPHLRACLKDIAGWVPEHCNKVSPHLFTDGGFYLLLVKKATSVKRSTAKRSKTRCACSSSLIVLNELSRGGHHSFRPLLHSKQRGNCKMSPPLQKEQIAVFLRNNWTPPAFQVKGGTGWRSENIR